MACVCDRHGVHPGALRGNNVRVPMRTRSAAGVRFSPGICRTAMASGNLHIFGLERSKEREIPDVNGNFRILKWRYCTIYKALCGTVPPF